MDLGPCLTHTRRLLGHKKNLKEFGMVPQIFDCSSGREDSKGSPPIGTTVEIQNER